MLFGFNCSKKQYKSLYTNNDSSGISDSSFQTNSSSNDTSVPESEAIVQYSTKFDSYITEGLKELSDSNIFSIRHTHSISRLDSIHQIYFAEKPGYDLLFYSNGDLFQNDRNDYAFIIYDKLNHLISISVYNDLTKDYSLMYQDLKVENGIKSDECYYYTYGRLDYQIASELVWLKEGFIKYPESLSEYSMCKIGYISDNQDIAIEYG